jgi:hypothetical protein
MLPTAISKVEQGDRRVDVDDLVAFAEALNTSTDDLLYRGEPEGLGTFDHLQALTAFAAGGFSGRILAVDPTDLDRLWELAQRRGLDPNRPGFWKTVASAARRDGELRTPAELRELWEREEAGRG